MVHHYNLRHDVVDEAALCATREDGVQGEEVEEAEDPMTLGRPRGGVETIGEVVSWECSYHQGSSCRCDGWSHQGQRELRASEKIKKVTEKE